MLIRRTVAKLRGGVAVEVRYNNDQVSFQDHDLQRRVTFTRLSLTAVSSSGLREPSLVSGLRTYQGNESGSFWRALSHAVLISSSGVYIKKLKDTINHTSKSKDTSLRQSSKVCCTKEPTPFFFASL